VTPRRLPPPDIVLLGADWRSRALLRAQLIEEGYEVLATDSWPMTRRMLRPGSQPKLVIVDLYDLEQPADVLRSMRVLMKPDCVIVLNALAALTDAEIEQLGFRVMERPIRIKEVVDAAANAIAAAGASGRSAADSSR
jgi:DNA-binding response OmpR family regulator